MIRRRSLALASCSHPSRYVPATVRSMELRVTDPETPLSRLFPLESVLEAADSVLDLSCRLVGLALGLQLDIAKHLAGDLLDFAYDSLFRSSIRSLSMICSPKK
jgi:hypothetical protein